MTNRMRLGGAVAVALTVAVAGVARADDTADKAKLEQRVQDLERELADVKSSIRGGYFTANSDLEARVAELERMGADNSMSSAWKAGMSSASGDGAFKVHWFGLIQNDWVWYLGDGDADTAAATGDSLNPGTEFRRIRLGANGQMYNNVKWMSEIEFAGGNVTIADMWIELAACEFGNIRVGHMKQPIGFDQLTSDKFTQFMERNYVNNLSPVRDTGIMGYGNAMDDQLLYQVGMFRESGSNGNDTNNVKDGEYSLTGRLSTRPMIEDDGTTWLHLGASARYWDIAGNKVSGTLGGTDLFSVSAGPENHQSPAFISVSGEADTANQYGLEAAYVMGPWTFLGEWNMVDFDLESGKNSAVTAWSLEGAYWLTGENTAYDKSAGCFGRTAPKHNFGDGDGQGAWQVGLRYDTIDMNDGAFDGGDIGQWTAAVRWWLNPNTAVMLNVAKVSTDDPANAIDDVTLLGLRFQLDF